jgi:nucleotide-binding universal stress UspA family protein
VTTEAAERVRTGDVEVEVMVVPDRPSVALSETAEERDARFIVVGSYGESPIKGAIVGSVPHKLLQISETPVVVVRA